MLDGLLGRGGFSSKCKSLIKLTRTRLDVIRRKRAATQKFLKKDIADLLTNGLEQNALGRAEGLYAEYILSSCYDFIDHVFDIILKHLSAMQKQRECPEECMEAVASLMFAAARFSDLPELRDLRDIFQERYGNSLEDKVNQQLVEHISPKPPAKEQRLQLLQDVASEFSIRFDAMGFDRRITAAEVHVQPKTQAASPPPANNKYIAAPRVQEHVQDGSRTEKRDHQEVKNREIFNGRDVLRPRIHKAPESGLNRENHDIAERGRGGGGSTGPANIDPVKGDERREKQRGDNNWLGHVGVQERSKRSSSTLSERRLDVLASPSRNHEEEDNVVVIPPRKLPGGEDASKLKLKNSLSLPPPYVRPGRNTSSKHGPGFQGNGENKNNDDNDTLSHDSFKRAQATLENNNNGVIGGFTEVYYKDDDINTTSNTRRRSSRRRRAAKSSASCSPDNNAGEEEVRVVRRVATSRRRNESSKKGLQILFDDGGAKPKDDEEKILDKMLQHYSKKEGGGEFDRPPRRKEKSGRGRENAVKDDDDGVQAQQHSSRSFSLPRVHVSSAAESETKKVFTRAASFDQDGSTPAKHVHPKLPNYDDLAARFAALRRNHE